MQTLDLRKNCLTVFFFQFIFDCKYVDEHYLTDILKAYKNPIWGKLWDSTKKIETSINLADIFAHLFFLNQYVNILYIHVRGYLGYHLSLFTCNLHV